MKNIWVLAIVLFLFSCSSNKYNAKNNAGNFEGLNAGKTYVFFHENDLKTKMEITSIEKDSIIGLHHKSRIALSKNTIWKVRKNNTAGTVILVGTSVGFIAVTAVIFSAVAEIGRALDIRSGDSKLITHHFQPNYRRY